MGKQSGTQLRCKSRRRLCRKKLRRNGADKPDYGKKQQPAKHFPDMRPVLRRNTHIDDLRDNKRHKQFKRGFQQFKQRS